jgi:exopolyphosphatase/guanosine-5'-triphosphate,3'-diphosphate pyrophosphatase
MSGEISSTTHAEKKYFAAIDLGSRNCRLLVAKEEQGRLETLEAFSRFVCLGEGVSRTQKLSKKSMDRAIVALHHCVKKMAPYTPLKSLAVTTAATRQAQNSQQFLSRVTREVGVDLQIITPEEEAFYAVLGCQELVHAHTDYAIIFDIGGGSTELILADFRTKESPQVLDVASIPLGVVNLSEGEDPLTFKHYSATVNKVLKWSCQFSEKNNLPDLMETARVQFVGTSGTTTTVAALHQNLRFYDRSKIDGSELTYENLENVIKYVQLLSPEERLMHPCIGQAQDDLILGGLSVFEGIYKMCPSLTLTVTDRGLRDGIVYALANHAILQRPLA